MMAFFFNFLLKISFLITLFASCAIAEIIVNKNDDGKQIQIEYELNYQMHEEFERIIDKGISINILEEIKIIKERDYFFDKEIASQKNYKRIEYHPLIKKYYFYERSEKKSYLSLTELIVDINKKRELQLKIDKKDINNNLLIINWRIEQNSLPKSLQLNLKKPDWFVLKILTYSL
jgi:hypothetical protein